MDEAGPRMRGGSLTLAAGLAAILAGAGFVAFRRVTGRRLISRSPHHGWHAPSGNERRRKEDRDDPTRAYGWLGRGVDGSTG